MNESKDKVDGIELANVRYITEINEFSIEEEIDKALNSLLKNKAYAWQGPDIERILDMFEAVDASCFCQVFKPGTTHRDCTGRNGQWKV